MSPGIAEPAERTKGRTTVKFLRGRAGIALSLAISITVAAACLAPDTCALYRGFARLQQVAGVSVLVGAGYLPANPKLARIVALTSVRASGISESEFFYNPPASEGRSSTILIERSFPCHFSPLLGWNRHETVPPKAS
jgi:hypothetical protein